MFHCKNCGSNVMSKAHRCFLFDVRFEGTGLRVWASFPEAAAEAASKYLNKEILCEIDGVEYYTDRISDDKFYAFVAFDPKSIPQKRIEQLN